MNYPETEFPIQIATECKPSSIGLSITEGIDIQRWKEIGHKLCRCEGALQWWIGDWISYGHAVYGEKYKDAISIFGDEARGEYGYSEDSLRRLASVASRVQLCHRCHNLSWTHHQVVSPLEGKSQKYWLSKAAENKWSVKELSDAIRGKLKDKATEARNLATTTFYFDGWIGDWTRGLGQYPIDKWDDSELLARIHQIDEIKSPLIQAAKERGLEVGA